ncbi:hypothetical protein ACLOJK_017823 [Asimina triloba]
MPKWWIVGLEEDSDFDWDMEETLFCGSDLLVHKEGTMWSNIAILNWRPSQGAGRIQDLRVAGSWEEPGDPQGLMVNSLRKIFLMKG